MCSLRKERFADSMKLYLNGYGLSDFTSKIIFGGLLKGLKNQTYLNFYCIKKVSLAE